MSTTLSPKQGPTLFKCREATGRAWRRIPSLDFLNVYKFLSANPIQSPLTLIYHGGAWYF